MADEKSNDNLSFRCPDMLKTKFSRIASAKGSNMTAFLVAYMESVVEEEERYIESIADIFDYERAAIKERRVASAQRNAVRNTGGL